MTPQTEKRFIKRYIRNNRPKSMEDVAIAIEQANKRILNRRSVGTDLKLEAELRAC
jgi:hypothetical protein